MIRYSPFLPEVIANPHPIYRRLLEEAPAYFIEEFQSWALSRFEDLWWVLADSFDPPLPRLGSVASP